MPKFTVTLRETVVYTVDVEVDTEDEAGEAAREVWALSEDPFDEFNGAGQGVEAFSVKASNS